MPRRIRSARHRCSIAFTMIELLVVIVILALLIALITAVASKVIYQQKVRNTEQIMQNVVLALDQFSTEDPLHAIYGRQGQETFGKYPPYQLSAAGIASGNCVSVAIESPPPGGWDDNLLADRLRRDMRPPGAGESVAISAPNDGNDDLRALYAYLRVFSPDSLSVIPDDVLKPITQSRDYVNPQGGGTTVGSTGLVDVLGIHDAWGVPLDYMLYVKCEWRLAPGASTPSWIVTERRPVLRSRGIDREVYDVWVTSNSDPTARPRHLSPPDKWLFSEPFCSPAAQLTDGPFYTTGLLPNAPNPASSANGWARAVAANEDYAYRPEGDTAK